MIKKFIVNHEFWRPQGHDLVYARSLKCASSFFANIFKANGWIKQTIDDIDWQRDHVFSFMTEPTLRHVKGLVEDAVSLGMEKQLLKFDRYTLQSIPWLGEHSVPLSVYWGEHFDDIEWTLIENDSLHHELRAAEICKTHGVNLNLNIIVDRNLSDDYEREVFEKVYRVCGPYKPLIRALSQDYDRFDELHQEYRVLRKPRTQDT